MKKPYTKFRHHEMFSSSIHDQTAAAVAVLFSAFSCAWALFAGTAALHKQNR